MLGCFARAVGQLGDGRFLGVFALGVGLTLLLLFGLHVVVVMAVGWLVPEAITLPFVGEVTWIGGVLGAASILMMLGLSVFLMVPVASAFVGLFLDRIADAVEDRHYPQLPPARAIPLAEALIDSINFLGVVIAVNLLALIAYLMVGPFGPILFWFVNGWLLGREYFTLVAMRRMDRAAAKALRKRHSGTVLAAGVLMAAPLSIPVVNLAVPVLGVATFTHLFHRLTGAVPR
ncbi:MAG: EI24 domain-containing protein [Rhodobacteraceae bacterium]|nr:EI24 domain-containing protein [Paracoccaceae bacterium]